MTRRRSQSRAPSVHPAAMPKVPPAPSAASRARGASVAPAAVETRGKGEEESSDSVSEAPTTQSPQ